MTVANDLYQQVILDHNKAPRNYGKLDPADRRAEGQNPLCGDEVTVYLKLEGDQVQEVKFEGRGCAISRASASLMTGAVKGKSREETQKLFEAFHAMVTGKGGDVDADALGKLAAFQGVSAYPARVKCASLAWHTLHAALEGTAEPVTTER